MKISRADTFLRDYRRLTEPLKQRIDQALVFLLQNLRHPSLQSRKLGGRRDSRGRDIWEAATARSGGADDRREDRITKTHRFTFVLDGDACVLRRIGPHNILRNP